MRKTNEELDTLIGEQEALIAADADRVDLRRGHVSRAESQLVKNRAEVIKTLDGQKETTTVTLRAGL